MKSAWIISGILMILGICGIFSAYYSNTIADLRRYILPATIIRASYLHSRPPASCDEECFRFRSLMSNSSAWSDGRPRSVVTVLIGRRDQTRAKIGIYGGSQMFAGFIKDFDRNFNDYYKYPLVVFYERLKVNDTEIAHLRNLTRSPVFFQPLEFTIPPFINQSSPLERCSPHESQGLGYKHMCRFHAKTVYEHPIMQTEGLEYVWRLDDDSFLIKNWTYDPFRFMKERKIRYGYVAIGVDSPCWVVGLWKAANEFWDRLNISQKRDCRERDYYSNNFEISALSVWRSSEYQQYVEYIDKLGGIFYHRWGDAPIKTLAVSRLVKTDELYKFTNIGYKHNVHVMA